MLPGRASDAKPGASRGTPQRSSYLHFRAGTLSSPLERLGADEVADALGLVSFPLKLTYWNETALGPGSSVVSN